MREPNSPRARPVGALTPYLAMKECFFDASALNKIGAAFDKDRAW